MEGPQDIRGEGWIGRKLAGKRKVQMSINPSLGSGWLPGQRGFLWKDQAPSVGVFLSQRHSGHTGAVTAQLCDKHKATLPLQVDQQPPVFVTWWWGEVSSSPRGICCHILSARKVVLRLIKNSQGR